MARGSSHIGVITGIAAVVVVVTLIAIFMCWKPKAKESIVNPRAIPVGRRDGEERIEDFPIV